MELVDGSVSYWNGYRIGNFYACNNSLSPW